MGVVIPADNQLESFFRALVSRAIELAPTMSETSTLVDGVKLVEERTVKMMQDSFRGEDWHLILRNERGPIPLEEPGPVKEALRPLIDAGVEFPERYSMFVLQNQLEPRQTGSPIAVDIYFRII